MLQIMMVIGAVSPLAFENKVMARAGAWLRLTAQAALGLIIAAAVYTALIFGLVELYPLAWPWRTLVFASGFAFAVPAAAAAALLVTPARFARFIVPGVCTVALLMPLSFYLRRGLGGSWQPIYILDIVGSLIGSCAVMRSRLANPRTPDLLPRLTRKEIGIAA